MSKKNKRKLVGKQSKLDKNKNGKIDGGDFKILRKENLNLPSFMQWIEEKIISEENDGTGRFQAIEDVKKGDYLKRTQGAKATYVKGDEDKGTNTFSCTDDNDMNKEVFIKRGKQVWVDFTH